ncbi:MAG: UDP-glucose--hexose-1-phosphate uridylyltransferase [Clostridiaceae bacterium]
MNIYKEIQRLVNYALNKKLIEKQDEIYARNKVLECLNLDDFQTVNLEEEILEFPSPVLDNILDWAYENNILIENGPVYRDLLDTKIMDCFIIRPSTLINKFNLYYNEDPKKATDFYYNLSKNSNYIRTDRIDKNIVWKTNTIYGDLDITINLSKPEKDPKAIAAAKNMKSTSYPLCLLCKENEGYRGRVNHPARQSHRIIPIKLTNKDWFIQYSPYVYYNEHCIIFNGEHIPMKISKDSFKRLLEFTTIFPHYFLGSNADLPIVGGSILSHDHFQGGCYEFAMAKAPTYKEFKIKAYEDISIGIVNWPMSVIRISGKDSAKLEDLADKILTLWRNYSDEEVGILAYSDSTPHNTITPIARKRGDLFELDLVLRNNRTSKEHPLGIFHPHNEVHHIKKENIGLIEVMGLAVLPARLKEELELLSPYLLNRNKDIKEDILLKHKDWLNDMLDKYQDINITNVDTILKEEVGKKFMTVLEHAGVYKRDEKGQNAFAKFINSIE